MKLRRGGFTCTERLIWTLALSLLMTQQTIALKRLDERLTRIESQLYDLRVRAPKRRIPDKLSAADRRLVDEAERERKAGLLVPLEEIDRMMRKRLQQEHAR